jgi:hypothetical protein
MISNVLLGPCTSRSDLTGGIGKNRWIKLEAESMRPMQPRTGFIGAAEVERRTVVGVGIVEIVLSLSFSLSPSE